MTSRHGAFLPAAFFAVAVVAVSGILPLWLDEILQLIETRDTSPAGMIVRLPRNSGAAPLGYLMQQATLRITGYSVRKARLSSAIFGIATVFAVGLLAAEMGIRYPWLAAAIFAIYPQSLRYAAESRIYSQALFFSTVATVLFVRLSKKATPAGAAAYWLALTAAIYTHPFSACLGLAHVAWSAWRREFRAAVYGGVALVLTAAAFLPWYLWSKGAWTAGIVRESFHFSASIKTPLMVFREVAGAGYWGSGLLLLLCALAIVRRRSSPSLQTARIQTLLILSIATTLVCVFAADAVFGYFVAARQFMWMLPAAAILAANAIERYERISAVLYVLLGLICIRQSITFFRAPHENWQAAAERIADDIKKGGCVMVAPSDNARLYQFFRPELARAQCQGPQMLLAVTPAASLAQRHDAVNALISEGYIQQDEVFVGGSAVLRFYRLDGVRTSNQHPATLK